MRTYDDVRRRLQKKLERQLDAIEQTKLELRSIDKMQQDREDEIAIREGQHLGPDLGGTPRT